jgi:Protein of unknown function (DUF3551)
MRPAILSLAVVSAAIFGGFGDSRAQSAYDYPWCAVYTNRSGATACYYASYGQCMATMRGIGGYCTPSPYFRGAAPYAERRSRRYYRDY